jgi:tetratricopeptide (TPR) repeat protein
MAFTVCARYRLPALPFLILFAAQGIWLTWTLIRDRNFVRLGTFLLITVGASVLVHTGVDALMVDHLRSHWVQSQVHIRNGDYTRAENALRRELSRNPSDSDVLNSLASVYNRQGRLELVEPTLLRAVEAASDHALPWLNLGDFYLKTRRPNAAREAYAMALRHDPRPVTQYRGQHSLGNLLMLSGDPAAAREAFAAAARHRPTPQIYYALSTANAKLGRHREQLEALERSVGLDSTFAPALRNLGVLVFKMGDLERAEHLLLMAVRRDPRSADAYRNLGIIYRQLGNHERANLALAEARRLANDRVLPDTGGTGRDGVAR